MTSPNFPVFVSAGEALTDLIIEDPITQRWVAKVGGSTWNVARVVTHLGISSAFAGAISNDIFGDALQAASEEAKLDLRFLQRPNKSPLLAIVHQTNPPKYFFVGDDSADLHFDASLLPQDWEKHVKWVHFGGISLARQPLASKLIALAEWLKKVGVSISFDPNFRALMDEKYDPTLHRMTELADVIKVSDEDLEGLFRSKDLATSFATMRKWNPNATFLYTKGEGGASLHIGNDEWHAKVPKVEVIDTVGAGDASIAALLYSFMYQTNSKPEDHLRFAVAAGAAACTGAGASPPSIAAIEQLLSP
jgi:fructokinase